MCNSQTLHHRKKSDKSAFGPAKDLALAIQRTHGQLCKTSRESTQETADECSRALDVKCQTSAVDDDPLLRKLRAVERTLSHRVAWHCPVQLAALFRDDLGGDSGPDEKGFALLYADPVAP